MRKSYVILLAAVVGLSSCDLMNPFGQLGDPEEKQKVIGEWEFEQSETEGNVHYPTAEEAGDKLILKADDTFFCIDKGREVEGDWDFYSNRRGNTISLMEDGNWECIDYRVESVDEQTLVYSFKPEGHSGARTTVTMVSAMPDPTSEE